MSLSRLTTLYISNISNYVSFRLFLSRLPLACFFRSRLLPHPRAYILHRYLKSPLPHISVASHLRCLTSLLPHIPIDSDP